MKTASWVLFGLAIVGFLFVIFLVLLHCGVLSAPNVNIICTGKNVYCDDILGSFNHKTQIVKPVVSVPSVVVKKTATYVMVNRPAPELAPVIVQSNPEPQEYNYGYNNGYNNYTPPQTYNYNYSSPPEEYNYNNYIPPVSQPQTYNYNYSYTPPQSYYYNYSYTPAQVYTYSQPQAYIYGSAPQAVTYGSAPQATTYGSAPQAVTYGGAPQATTYGSAPQATTGAGAPTASD